MQDKLKTLGASNHSISEREQDDWYATPPEAMEELLKIESFDKDTILEPAVGGGHIAKFFENKKIIGYDIINRGFPNTIVKDFLMVTKDELPNSYDIVTNPPYDKKILVPFVEHCLTVSPNDSKIAMLLKLQFLESEKRYLRILKDFPPNRVHIFVKRIYCYKRGTPLKESSAICYCWFIWDKKEKVNKTTIDWIYRKR